VYGEIVCVQNAKKHIFLSLSILQGKKFNLLGFALMTTSEKYNQ
jgi:hypothetical protein